MKKKSLLFVICMVINNLLSAQCNTVNSIIENFEGWKSISSCWGTQSGLSMIYPKNNRITFYSLMTPKEDLLLITPKVKAGYYTLSFESTNNGGNSSVELFALQHEKEKNTLVSFSKPLDANGGKQSLTLTLKKDTHIAFKVLLTEMHQAVYLDNIILKAKR